ncbi:histidine kinase [Nonomuraea sp. NBC_01738]|uniref:sensor histidine kinase n=1 Tax=Nonomuraea sp. NBC_01738 TaxID=2976003 RepID=UPI002E15E989|nr:histidine kinase [Nonomuraea sp. NBC_01738]
MTSSSALRLATWLVAAVSVGFPALCLVYLLSGRLDIAVIVLTSLAAVGVPHFLNMRAALRGVRPPLFPLTIILQAVFTYLPDPYLPSGLSGLTAQLLACTLLIFVPLWASVPLVGLMAGLQFAAIMTSLPVPVIAALYALTIPVVGIMVAAVVRLALVTGALEEARAELAEAAVLKERLRISRDLHDGLGHSLTAIALKGDLAGRLIDRDPGTARSEVGDLVKVAREAAQEVRQVARGYREISLSGETQRAVALLEASGVAAQAHLAPGALPRPSEEALAWGVREGVTNVLRHSRATTCTITTSFGAGTVRLEIVNDGAGGSATGTPGSGLAGLRERAAQAGGDASAGPVEAGAFLLVVEVPAVKGDGS